MVEIKASASGAAMEFPCFGREQGIEEHRQKAAAVAGRQPNQGWNLEPGWRGCLTHWECAGII